MYYVQEKVFVGLDNVQPEFNLKEKILGPGVSRIFLKTSLELFYCKFLGKVFSQGIKGCF